jgi:two-component system response regulator FlrC
VLAEHENDTQDALLAAPGAGAKRILVVEDDEELREAIETTLGLAGYTVQAVAGGRQAIAAVRDAAFDIVLSDVQMPQMDGHELLVELRRHRPQLPVVLMTAYGTIERAVDAMRQGAVDYLVKPFEIDALLELLARTEAAAQAGRSPATQAGDDDPTAPIAHAPRSVETCELARRVAASNATVLLSGDSGTGKEVIARYIHACSPRREQPFVAINCAAIPDHMLEAVLFGHEKGAFTGATTANPGKFEQAQQGTLLLDEISEMPLALQAKLLRVLQEREVERVGGRRVITLDVRVVATTNRDLREEVAEGRFREDLYFRLSVMPIRLAPLRERREDIAPLARHMLARHTDGRPPPHLSEDACRKLQDYAWPGNVRELDNLMQRSLILLTGDEITSADLVFDDHSVEAMTPAAGFGPEQGELRADMQAIETKRILDVVRTSRTRKEAAERLGMPIRTLRHRLARLREQGVDVDAAAGTGLARNGD